MIATTGGQIPYLTAYLGAAKPARAAAPERCRVLRPEEPRAAGDRPLRRRDRRIGPAGVRLAGDARIPRGVRAAFPELPAGVGEGMVEMPAYTAVEALLTALDTDRGRARSATSCCGRRSTGSCSTRLRGQSGSTRTARPPRRTTSSGSSPRRRCPATDANGPQARRRGADLDGIFGPTTPSPSKTDPTCERRPAPPWAT